MTAIGAVHVIAECVEDFFCSTTLTVRTRKHWNVAPDVDTKTAEYHDADDRPNALRDRHLSFLSEEDVTDVTAQKVIIEELRVVWILSIVISNDDRGIDDFATLVTIRADD